MLGWMLVFGITFLVLAGVGVYQNYGFKSLVILICFFIGRYLAITAWNTLVIISHRMKMQKLDKKVEEQDEQAS